MHCRHAAPGQEGLSRSPLQGSAAFVQQSSICSLMSIISSSVAICIARAPSQLGREEGGLIGFCSFFTFGCRLRTARFIAALSVGKLTSSSVLLAKQSDPCSATAQYKLNVVQLWHSALAARFCTESSWPRLGLQVVLRKVHRHRTSMVSLSATLPGFRQQ